MGRGAGHQLCPAQRGQGAGGFGAAAGEADVALEEQAGDDRAEQVGGTQAINVGTHPAFLLAGDETFGQGAAQLGLEGRQLSAPRVEPRQLQPAVAAEIVLGGRQHFFELVGIEGAQPLQPFARRQLLNLRLVEGVLARSDLHDHLVLAGEMAEDRARTQPGLGADVLGARGMETATLEGAGGGAEDFLTSLLMEFFVLRAGHD